MKTTSKVESRKNGSFSNTSSSSVSIKVFSTNLVFFVSPWGDQELA